MISLLQEPEENVTDPYEGALSVQWANQGVLLLNTALTVRAHTAASHAKKGWEDFTDAAIRAMSKQREGLVFLLWGKHAQVKATKGIIDAKRHHVLQCAHPSGLSANKVGNIDVGQLAAPCIACCVTTCF